MSDSSKIPEERSSSEDESKMETLSISDNKDGESSSESVESAASAASLSSQSELAAASPILYRQLRPTMVSRNPLLSKALFDISPEVSSSGGNFASARKTFHRAISALQEKDSERNLNRKRASQTAIDLSHSDKNDPPAKKLQIDTSIEKAMPLPEPRTSEPLKSVADVSPMPTGNVDLKSPACSTEKHTPLHSSQVPMPTSSIDTTLSVGSHSEIGVDNLLERSENNDSTQGGSVSTNEELGGARPSNFTRPQGVLNMLILFEHLLNQLFELESFLDEHQFFPDETREEQNAGPLSSSTASDRQPEIISDESGAGVESTTAQTTHSVSADCEAMEVQESGKESEKEPPTANEPKRDSAAIQENRVGTSLGEASNLNESSPNLNLEAENLNSSSDILPRLQPLFEEARDLLNQCIDTTERVLCICVDQGTNRSHGELQSHMDGVLDKLHQLDTVRKECSALFKKCRNRNETAGLSYIIEVKTHIAQAYNRLLADILELNDHFQSNVQSDPQPPSGN